MSRSEIKDTLRFRSEEKQRLQEERRIEIVEICDLCVIATTI